MQIAPVDLGVCRGYVYESDDHDRAAVILPGALLAGMPASGVVAAALLAKRFRVVQVWVEFLDRSVDATAWSRERASAALREAGDRDGTLPVAKLLTTRAAGLAAERSLPAVWLTPLLTDDACVELLRARTAPAHLVGGTPDPMWNGPLARGLSGDVLELPDADHGFGAPDGDPLELLANLGRIVDAVGAFVTNLP